ncbi:Uncharacterised protein [Zhongshania aliphaticivorans]|uniref:OmpA-like domain-containing protein n=1 Tax=Zhongshania aliphaticivorans TaxID=1470434 RepID=A0A5S9MUI4_9GAMM|nr:OmpA family protein [Zhongshania aliphaticivorans]CAA0081059.1 Uncharacterised protein [Zhongshania aliphaticivorans]CAA0085299.1 Uncharacterised protein [Zhongshania aliphaticivorans]
MGFSRTSQNNTHLEEDNPYWVSFSDIMAGLLVIFILASMALILQLQDKNEQVNDAIKDYKKADAVRRTIIEEIVTELKIANIEVTVGENHTVIRIPEDVISFDQGRFTLPRNPNIRKNILKIGEVLGESIRKDKRWEQLDTVFVEGHTDELHCPKRLCPLGNWGLSANRAISVWRFWDEGLADEKKLDQLENHIGDKLFSVSGYAETRPEESTVGIPPTRESRAKNRRIDVRFTIRRPNLTEFEDMKAGL